MSEIIIVQNFSIFWFFYFSTKKLIWAIKKFSNGGVFRTLAHALKIFWELNFSKDFWDRCGLVRRGMNKTLLSTVETSQKFLNDNFPMIPTTVHDYSKLLFGFFDPCAPPTSTFHSQRNPRRWSHPPYSKLQSVKRSRNASDWQFWAQTGNRSAFCRFHFQTLFITIYPP